MSVRCGFSSCKPREIGGCPCRAVAIGGGGLTVAECAELTGMPRATIRKIESVAKGKLRRLPNLSLSRWRAMLNQWPHQESPWDSIAGHAVEIGKSELRAMNRAMNAKFKQLGWK